MVLVSTPNDLRNSYFPLVGSVAGVILALLSHRFPRLWNSIVGVAVGWAGMMWFVTYNTTWDQVPIVLSVLGSLVGGLIGLVLDRVVSGIVCGYCIAILVIVCTAERLFTIDTELEAGVFIVLLCAVGVVFSLYQKTGTLIFGSAMSGALLSATMIDIYGDGNFYHISTMFTIFNSPGVKLPRECNVTCYYMLALWGVLTLLGLLVQVMMYFLVPMEEETFEYQVIDQGAVWAPMGSSKQMKRAEQSFGQLGGLVGEGLKAKMDEASFNYLPTDHMPDQMRTLSNKLALIFARVQKQFGFQLSNKRNQQEHLLMLVFNAMSRLDLKAQETGQDLTEPEREAAAVKMVHDKLYENYIKWCEHLGLDETYMQSNANPVLMNIENMALMMLVWGEASSMRHAPESLCFITYNMLKEFRNNRGQFHRDAGSFLSQVIRPLYIFLKSDTGDIHTKRRNYDDVNEFFWTKSCFDYTYCNPEYSFTTQEDEKEAEKAPLAVGLAQSKKTYVEKKSWWHVVMTFYPLISFYIVSFHILVCIAWALHEDNKSFHAKQNNNVLMVSFVVTMSFVLLFREFLELYILQGKKTSPQERIGSTMRIVVKTGFALLLSFYYYRMVLCDGGECGTAWSRFLTLSAIYLLPLAGQILTIMFPLVGRIGNAILLSPSLKWFTQMWWPSTALYLGHDVRERDSHYFSYQLFWVLLIIWKMMISFNFQVVPCLAPTMWIWYSSAQYFSAPLRAAMILATWIPFFIVYMFDMYIWFACWQGLAGLVVGMKNRVGQIHEFSMLPYLFSDFPDQLGQKFFQTKKPEALPNVVVDGSKGGDGINMDTKTYTSYGSIEDGEMEKRAQQNLQRFASIWNEMIDDLRHADMMSNQEQFIFKFRKVELGRENNKVKIYQAPLFVSTSSINACINYVAANAEQFNQSIVGREDDPLDFKSTMVLSAFMEYFSQTTRRESVADLWNLAVKLVEELTPRGGQDFLKEFQDVVESLALPRLDDGQPDQHPYAILFRTMQLERISSLKPKLLNLVRGARLARAAWKKHRINQNHLTSPSAGMMHKSPSLGTLKIKDKMEILNRARRTHQYNADIEKHLSLLRDQLRDVLRGVIAILNKTTQTGRLLEQYLENAVNVVLKSFGTGKDHMTQLDKFLLSRSCDVVLNSLYTFLTVSNEFVPQNSSARRRILFFCNSLFMDMPEAPPISQMHSLTTLTPFYSEDVLYSKAYLQNRTEQGFSVLLYLQTVYPAEWANFCERMRIKAGDASILDWAQPDLQMEVRLWATRRGQTLFRTVDGMMMHERAIKVLATLETLPQIASDLKNQLDGRPFDQHSGSEAKSDVNRPSPEVLACLKYQYVVSCQVYGRQKEELDPKANDIEFLLEKFPNLRVAYIDNKKDEGKDGQPRSRYYSCLIKATRGNERLSSPPSGSPNEDDEKVVQLQGRASKSVAQMNADADDEWEEGDDGQGGTRIEHVYRIELPGNPIIGEGKPENQNHAIIFTRGEFVQTIDMNQEGYFEEAVKMRNLLEEFDKDDSRKPTTIVGFREHIFTGGLSSIANYMALQEGCFVTLGQRVLHDPLKMRLHYGHPDLFDKVFYMTRGGVSKASKGINLSEDIFAGFNTVLRGGNIAFKEYIQCGKGRDVGLQQLYKFEGKLSCGNAMQALTRDMFRICRSVDFLQLFSFFYGGIGFYISTLLAVWGLYAFCYQRVLIAALNLSLPKSFIGIDTVGYWIGTMGVLLTLPIICSIGIERGVWKASWKVLYMLISGGPLFFMFHMGTKAHYFARTILSGGAKYRPTGRGFVADHTKFAELYRFYAQSHFIGAVEMIVLLVLYGVFDRRVKHYWAVTWCAWVIVLSWLLAPLWLNPMMFEWEQVVKDTKDFMRWMARPEGSGERCWKSWWHEENSFIDSLPTSSKMLLAGISLRHGIVACCIFWYSGVSVTSPTALGCAGIMMMVVGFYTISNRHVSASQLCFFRGLKAIYVTVALSLFAILLVLTPPDKRTLKLSSLVFLALVYLLATFSSLCLSFGYRIAAVQQLSCLYDYIIGLTLLGMVSLASLLVVPTWIQTRLLFHNAFSKGVLIDDLLKGGRAKGNDEKAPSGRLNLRGRSQTRRANSKSKPKSAFKPPRSKKSGIPADLPVDTSLVSKSAR
mmetsp:Transcript_8911/g.21917  ORF Transcript_8911/g.21917 Transcript_8911/m.21917 type:complete len:2135 (-) Transcript_8911:326-6730(-)